MRYIFLALVLSIILASCDKPISGCTDKNSFSYDPLATEDNGSCIDMHGCLGWLPSKTQSGDVISSLGDAYYDAKFNEEIALQREFFSKIPSDVGILMEMPAENKNAYASPDGFILFGYRMFYDMLDKFGELPIAGILAHEWGHRTQQVINWQDYSQPAYKELEADAFSGFYLFLAKQWAWSQVDQYYSAIYSFGDTNFNSPYHHGTSEERLAAAHLGVETANWAVQNQHQFTYNELHQIFIEAIRTMIKPRESKVEYLEIEFPKNMPKEQIKLYFPRK